MLAGLRTSSDESLGIDDGFLLEAMTAFSLSASAQLSRAEIQGTFHRLYDAREPRRGPRILRVAAIAGAPAADLMKLECALATPLREAGFPVPACEYREIVQKGVPRGVHLVERIEGERLASLDDDEARMLVVLRWVGRFLRHLHRVNGTGFGPVSLAKWPSISGVHAYWDNYLFVRLAEHVRSCREHDAITDGEATNIATLFEAARPMLRTQRGALLHGDPGSHNFIVDASAIRGVIDWEDALVGDPLFDLASLCTFHPERRHTAIWSAYGASLDGEAWRRFWLYFLRIALAKTVHRYRFAYADRPDRPPASHRIQLALKRLAEAR